MSGRVRPFRWRVSDRWLRSGQGAKRLTHPRADATRLFVCISSDCQEARSVAGRSYCGRESAARLMRFALAVNGQ